MSTFLDTSFLISAYIPQNCTETIVFYFLTLSLLWKLLCDSQLMLGRDYVFHLQNLPGLHRDNNSSIQRSELYKTLWYVTTNII